MSARRQHFSKKNLSSVEKAFPVFSVDGYDTELERLSAERNRAYERLCEVENFAKSLNGEYAPVGEYLLWILYEKEGITIVRSK